MSGHLIIRCGGPISWKSLCKRCTELSSADSENMATDEYVKDTMSIRLYACDFNMDNVENPMVIYNDNRVWVNWPNMTTTKLLTHLNWW